MNKKQMVLSFLSVVFIILLIGFYNKSKFIYNGIGNKKSNVIDVYYSLNDELDKFYSDIDYDDIRKIDYNYSLDNAKSDNYYVFDIVPYNLKLYDEFKNMYSNKKKSFIRVVYGTVEGNVLIYDIKYDNELDEFTLVADYTRDLFTDVDDRTIKVFKYKNCGEYKYNGLLYWVLYNDSIDDENFNTDNVFVISFI